MLVLFAYFTRNKAKLKIVDEVSMGRPRQMSEIV